MHMKQPVNSISSANLVHKLSKGKDANTILLEYTPGTKGKFTEMTINSSI